MNRDQLPIFNPNNPLASPPSDLRAHLKNEAICVLSASVRSPKKNLTYRDQLRIGLVMGSGPEAQNYIT
jgi:hypothetical protein